MQHPGRHGSGRTAAAACGDPTDFASLSVAYFAALEAASDAGAAALGSSRRLHAEEIDINLRLAVFGLSLGHYTVHYDNAELQRLAFAEAFSPAREQPVPVGHSVGDIPGHQDQANLDGTASKRRPNLERRVSRGSKKELRDTECVFEAETERQVKGRTIIAAATGELSRGCTEPGSDIAGNSLNLPDLDGLSGTCGSVQDGHAAANQKKGQDGAAARRRLAPAETNALESLGRRLVTSGVSTVQGDPTCNPENPEFWKREREKSEEHDRQLARDKELSRQTRTPCDQPHAVYITYEDSDEQGRKAFIGQTLGGKRSGKGVLTWKDGSKYSGEWCEDQSNGFGQEKYQNGSFYIGGFKNDERHGFGEFCVSDEMSYAGTWKEGQMDGVVYITEVRRDGQVKLIPAMAERGEVHRRPQDPLSSIVSVKQQVEVAVKFAKDASSAARQVVRSLSLQATELTKHIIASRSPSPYTGLDNTTKSPIPPFTGTRTLSIPEDSTDSDFSGLGFKTWQETVASVTSKRQRPASAGGSPMMRAGLPPLPQAKLSGSQRPITANPNSTQHHCKLDVSPGKSAEIVRRCHVGPNAGIRIRLAEDGLASVTASPAPSATDTLQSLYSTATHCTDTREFEGKDRVPAEALAMTEHNSDSALSVDISMSRTDEGDRSGNFSDEDLEIALALLLTFPSPMHSVQQPASLRSSPSPDEMVAILLGEQPAKFERADSGTASGQVGQKWDETVLHGKYDLVRSSRPHITGNICQVQDANVGMSRIGTFQHSTSPQTIPIAFHPMRAGFVRPGSPFPQPSSPISNFGLTPRSMRLRPLPRALRSHPAPGDAFDYGTYLLPTSDSQAANDRNDIALAGDGIQRYTPPPGATTGRATPTIETGTREKRPNSEMANDFIHPANEDRMFVAVVTAAAAEVVSKISGDVAENAGALARASSMIEALSQRTPSAVSAAWKVQDEVVVVDKDKKTSNLEPVLEIAAVAQQEEPDDTETPEKNESDAKRDCNNGDQGGSTVKTLADEPADEPELRYHAFPASKTCVVAMENDTETSSVTGPTNLDSRRELNELPADMKLKEKHGKSGTSFGEVDDKQFSRTTSGGSVVDAHKKGLEEIDWEVGVIRDDEDDVDGQANALESTWGFETPRLPPRQIRKGPQLSSNQSLQSANTQNCHPLSSPAELAWRLIAKFRTGFGLGTDELQAFERTFKDRQRLVCFVGFINTMHDHEWLQVQNHFVEDAAKAHGVGLEAQTLVREEAYSWMLERHANNPVNRDCMARCGLNVPFQTLVSASYEVITGLRRGERFAPAEGGADILALRLLILHSFVESCWRAWQCSQRLKPHDTRNQTGSLVVPKTPPQSRPLWPQSEAPGRTVPGQSHYVSPLAKRVRPGSSKAEFGRILSAGRERPLQDHQRPFSARILAPSADSNLLFSAQQAHRLASFPVKSMHEADEQIEGYGALRYIRDELSRSVFDNVMEAFVWFDLDRKQSLSASELDVGLKSLGILGIDVDFIFSLRGDQKTNQDNDTRALDEIEFARLFQWNEQLTANGKSLFIFGESFAVASKRAKQSQKRIIEKVKAAKHARSQLTGTTLLACSSDRARKSDDPGNRGGADFTDASRLTMADSPNSLQGTSACRFCKRSHVDDFVQTVQAHEQVIARGCDFSQRSGQVPVNRSSPLTSRLPADKRVMVGDRMSNDSLEEELNQGYREFTPNAILGVMVTAVLDVDLRARIMSSRAPAPWPAF